MTEPVRPPASSAAKKATAAKTPAKSAAKTETKAPPVPQSMFQSGNKIKHATFGAGLIKSVTGDILEIEFKDGDVKFIREDFVARA